MVLSSSQSRKRFAIFAWVVLAYNLPVILWGAYVRASFSGDGCGAHWPFCNGQVIPQNMAAPMAIEFTHRMMTSADTIAMLVLVAWAFAAFPRQHAVRRYAVWSLVFLFIEALLGAGLVLFRLVAKDQSAGRAGYLSAHLTNTMLLLAAITATAWLANSGAERLRLSELPGKLKTALVLTVLVSVTGAIAALGDTLFPAASLSTGMRQDLSSASSVLLRLRMTHPAIALLGAGYLVWAASSLARRSTAAGTRRAAYGVIGLAMFQLAVGISNLALLAPIWMQLFHLLVADAVWVAIVLLALETAGAPTRQVEPTFSPALGRS
ncbi:MAG: COX15/CtaA family protein [Acidobacteriaceae bacterium]|nr:COX15/CtaA family protein [Acidobacteriaceae bacterium]